MLFMFGIYFLSQWVLFDVDGGMSIKGTFGVCFGPLGEEGIGDMCI